MLKRLGLASLCSIAVFGTFASLAAAAGKHRAPPPEAFEACSGKAAGDACSVTLGEHTINGTCDAPPDSDGALACRPEGPPPGGPGGPDGHGPPPEALDACHGKAAGDACSVTLRDRTIDGTCRQGPDGDGPLACAPSGPPPERR